MPILVVLLRMFQTVNMAKGITVKLEMMPMYADWVKHCYGADADGKVMASEKHPLGLLIKNLLRPRPYDAKKRTYKPGAFVEFILPDYDEIDTLSRNYISENSEKLFYKKVRSLFYYDLHDFIEKMTNSGVTEVRRIILLFCEVREIESSHFKVNSLEREFRRHKRAQKNFKNTQEISSAFARNFSLLIPLLVCSCPFVSSVYPIL